MIEVIKETLSNMIENLKLEAHDAYKRGMAQAYKNVLTHIDKITAEEKEAKTHEKK